MLDPVLVLKGLPTVPGAQCGPSGPSSSILAQQSQSLDKPSRRGMDWPAERTERIGESRKSFRAAGLGAHSSWSQQAIQNDTKNPGG